jgi:DNA-binding response OmpR family regulator
MSLHSHVIGVFNTSEDVTDLLRIAFELAGFVVVTAFTNLLRDGQVDLETFMRQHRPKIIVYDIGVPYEQNWQLFEHIRGAPACDGVTFVLTTTNVRHVRQLAGSEPLHEIVGKPYDIDEIVNAVKQAGGRPLERDRVN